MVRTKKVRLFAALTAMVMLVCMLPLTGMAANTVAITTAEVDDATGVITVAGTISAGEQEVTILASRQAEQINAYASMNADSIVYIDQITADADGAYEFSFIPRAAVAGKFVTVFVGGTEVDTLACKNIEMPVGKAGSITGKAEYIFDVDAIEFTVDASAADDGWAEFVSDNIAVYDGNTAVSTIEASYAEGKITITGVDLTDVYEKALTIKIEVPDFDEAKFDFKVVSPVAKAAEQLPASIAVNYLTDGVEDKANGKALITLPVIDNAYGTTLNWAFDGETGVTATATGYELARAAEGGEATTYTLKATVSLGTLKEAEKTYTISVKAIGAAGPTITDSTISTGAAFGTEGKTVAVKATDIDPANETLTVNGVAMYWSPQRNAFVGVVEVADIAGATVEAVDGASPEIYYGKANKPESNTKVSLADVGIALAIKNGATATVQQKIAADVDGNGKFTLAEVGLILAVKNGADPASVFKVLQ